MKPEHRRLLGVTFNDQPSLTDQSQAEETNLTRLVARFGISGAINGNPATPMYGDFSNLPEDLRGFIETSRTLEDRRLQLPEALRNIPLEELIYMTPEALAEKLKPAEQPKPTEDTK